MGRKILLISVLILGLGLRLIRLDNRPAGFTWDEAALGYNAYSLLFTGKDEHAALMPLVFKSFGDYKPGLYIYFSVPAVAIFGLNEFATRLPSAIFGTLLVLVVYLISKELESLLKIENCKLKIAPAAALLMAVNPWAIHFSRGAWEANLALFLTTLGVTFFIRGIKNNSHFPYLISAFFLGLTLWSYQGAKLFTPLLLLSLIVVYRPVISIKKMLLPLGLFLVLLFPILAGFGNQSGRLKVFSVFSYTRTREYVSQILTQDQTTRPGWAYYLYHTELLDQLRGIAQRYLNHLSPRFLFVDGDWSSLRHSTPYQGYLFYPQLLILLMGLYLLIKNFSHPLSKFVIIWLFLAPVPAALSRDIVSGVRSLPLIIPLTIISGIGLAKISRYSTLLLCFSVTLLLFFIYFLDLYFIHSPQFTARDWLYPYRPAFSLIRPYLSSYRRIYFTDQLGQPYIFYLFYNQVSPAYYQSQNAFIPNPSGDVGRVDRVDNLVFAPVYWPSLRYESSALFIGGQYELPESDLNQPGLERIAEITYPNGDPALRIVGIP